MSKDRIIKAGWRCKVPNEHVEIAPGIIQIKLTLGKFTLIDSADWGLVSRFRWCTYKARRTFYAIACAPCEDGTRWPLKLHRLLVGATKGQEPDHVDGDGLNNRRSNLELGTKRSNQQNQKNRAVKKSSEYPGVCWHKRANKWLSSIKVNKTRYSLGLYATEKEAYSVYEKAASAAESGVFVPPVKNCTSKSRGVYFWAIGNVWRGQIQHNKRRIYLGGFDTEQEAIDAVLKARQSICYAATA
jgi:hypothetical protein